MRLSKRIIVLLGAGLMLIIFSLNYYPEDIVGIDVNFKLDIKSPVGEPGRPLDTLGLTDSHPSLKRGLTKAEHEELVDLLEILSTLLQKNNVTYLMSDGTLLGSYFFHDFIPWDDDLDMLVAWKDRDTLLNVFLQEEFREIFDVSSYQDTINWYSLETLEGRNPKLQLKADLEYYQKRADFKLKFFKKSSRKAGVYEWKWPFIDITFYNETTDTIYNLSNQGRRYHIKKRDFFPLHLRPFGRLWLPAPHDTRSMLKTVYRKFLCLRDDWDHKREVFQSKSYVSCRHILAVYPHVHRSKVTEAGEASVVESLVLGSRLLHSVRVEEPWHNVKGYYDLQ